MEQKCSSAPVNQPNKEALARVSSSKPGLHFQKSVSQHIFPVHPHDPEFLIMIPNYSIFTQTRICQLGNVFCWVWFMKEEAETFGGVSC